jgi:toxin YoeB
VTYDWREAWSGLAREDYDWFLAKDPDLAARIDALIDDIKKRPFAGMGKPEPLRFDLKGWWSRRIDRQHRLVYRVSGKQPRLLEVAQCRFHY